MERVFEVLVRRQMKRLEYFPSLWSVVVWSVIAPRLGNEPNLNLPRDFPRFPAGGGISRFRKECYMAANPVCCFVNDSEIARATQQSYVQQFRFQFTATFDHMCT